jgi:hypothetical protein
VFPITPTTGRFISWFSLTHPQILKRILKSRKNFLDLNGAAKMARTKHISAIMMR